MFVAMSHVTPEGTTARKLIFSVFVCESNAMMHNALVTVVWSSLSSLVANASVANLPWYDATLCGVIRNALDGARRKSQTIV